MEKKIVVSVFSLVAIALGIFAFININGDKHLENYNERNGENYGDRGDYVFAFDEVTVPNSKIVAFDNTGNDYIRYFVIEFTGNEYILYSYYFLKDHNQYLEMYDKLVKTIVDYNYEEYMLKSLDDISLGTYSEIINNMQTMIDDNSIYLIY